MLPTIQTKVIRRRVIKRKPMLLKSVVRSRRTILIGRIVSIILVFMVSLLQFRT